MSSSARARPQARRRRRSRWPIFVGIFVVLGLVAGVMIVNGTVNKAIDQFTLPLDHEDIIRQQAAEKGVDAALIAAVIDTESKFSVAARSSAGARGLMQITPEAAQDIARHSGATNFHTSDLSNPEINIKYGTYLLAERIEFYGGDVVAALASYNAGPGPVEKWGGSDMTIDDIRAELKRLGFSDMRDFVRWGPRMGVQLRPSGALGDKSRCVKEVSETSFKGERTITFKLHDKVSALDKLARHLGMYAEADGKALAQGAIAVEMFRKMMSEAEAGEMPPGAVRVPTGIAGV